MANARLLNLVEKTFRFRFRAFHIPGKMNCAADALSHAPVGDPVHLEILGLGEAPIED